MWSLVEEISTLVMLVVLRWWANLKARQRNEESMAAEVLLWKSMAASSGDAPGSSGGAPGSSGDAIAEELPVEMLWAITLEEQQRELLWMAGSHGCPL